MTSDTDIADVLPLRPADHGSADPLTRPEAGPASPTADRAQRAREKKFTAGLGLWLRLQTALAGGSLIDNGMPALLVVWARHEQAAKAWKTRFLRWPRWAWGVVHTWVICPVLRTLEWGTESFPKLAFVVTALVTTLLWFPHFTITITL
jgi:hypothetical protein